MSDDWQPGDLALCISEFIRVAPWARPPRKDAVYIVDSAVRGDHWKTGKPLEGLWLVGFNDINPNGTRCAYATHRFRKITDPGFEEPRREAVGRKREKERT